MESTNYIYKITFASNQGLMQKIHISAPSFKDAYETIEPVLEGYEIRSITRVLELGNVQSVIKKKGYKNE